MIGPHGIQKGGFGPPFVVWGGLSAWTWVAALMWSLAVHFETQAAETAAVVVYRCPGPPVLYTDALTPEQAKAQQCRSIEGAPLNAGEAPGRSALGRASAASRVASSANGATAEQNARKVGSVTTVDAAAQREREAQARGILQAELIREEERLAALRQEFNRGEPERRADEKNAAKYQARVEALRLAISRKEADIAALKREISLRTPG